MATRREEIKLLIEMLNSWGYDVIPKKDKDKDTKWEQTTMQELNHLIKTNKH